jgi:hypothetical protein
MVALHPQFVQDASHATTAVLVSWEEWKAVVAFEGRRQRRLPVD